ncbi:MAG: DUF1614 domain-containing protein [Candidatus Thermoplasmatota archaeon]
MLLQIGQYLFFILLPILAIYLGYLIITKAFNDMGFSTGEAVIIVFVCFILGYGIIDSYVGIPFQNIYLFTYSNWNVGINTGGAIIPLIVSIYLTIKNKLDKKRLGICILLVALTTYLVTTPDPEKGIISVFPYWCIPIVIASILSSIFYRKERRRAPVVAYVSGTLGVLIGADIFHLYSLLNSGPSTVRTAVIGGASVFDMIFITGISAVIIDGILIRQEKHKKQ